LCVARFVPGRKFCDPADAEAARFLIYLVERIDENENIGGVPHRSHWGRSEGTARLAIERSCH
jgi:hypothetical protein